MHIRSLCTAIQRLWMAISNLQTEISIVLNENWRQERSKRHATPIALPFCRLAAANGFSFALQLFENEEKGDKGGRRRVVRGREAGCFGLGESLFLGGGKRGAEGLRKLLFG